MNKFFFVLFSFVILNSYSQQSKIDSLYLKLEKASELNELISINEEIVNFFLSTNQTQKAFNYVENIREEYSKENKSTLLALTYKLEGNILRYTSNLDTLIYVYKKGLDFIDKKDESKMAGDLYLNVGSYMKDKNIIDSTLHYYKEAEKIYSKINNYRGLCFLHYNLADYNIRNNNYYDAEINLGNLIKYNKFFKNPFFDAKSYLLIGLINMSITNIDIAIDNFNVSLEKFKLINSPYDEVIVLGSLATAYINNKDYNNAEKAFKKIFSIYNEQELLIQISTVVLYSDYIELLLKTKKFKEAEEQLSIAYKYMRKTNYYYVEPTLHLHEAEILLNRNKIKEAFNIISTININELHIESRLDYYRLLIEYYKINNKYENALLTTEIYNNLKDSIANENLQKKIIYTQEKFETEKKEKENLRLKANNAEQESELEKESKRKWYFGIGFFASILTLGVFMFYYKRNKEQKTIIESLQKDLHHRVKNNLAIIDALIDDIKDEFDNEKFKDKLTELQNRIDSINEVHSQLYKNTDVTNLQLKKYVGKLAKNVQQSFSKDNIVIKQHIDDSLQLKADKSFPIGLIINEFLTNSFKYAFNDDAKGIVSIVIEEKPKTFVLSLNDNGKGLPEDFDISKLDSFGIEVMKLLSKQLKGTFELDGSKGVNLNIEFPKI